MKAVKRKLKNKSGASIIISLMFLLVAMMVGTVCLVAAYNNTGRMTHSVDDRLEYHAVESAIKLITADMEDVEFVLTPTDARWISFTVDDEGCKENNVKVRGKIATALLGTTYTPSTVQGKTPKSFTLKLEGEYEKLSVSGNISIGYDTYTATETSTDDDGTFNVELPDFTLIISLWQGGTDSVKSNTTVLTFRPMTQIIREYNEGTETLTRKLRLKWMEDPMIENEDLRDTESGETA